MTTAREYFETAQDRALEALHQAQVWSGTDPTTLEHIGIGLACFLLVAGAIYMLVRNCPQPATPPVVSPPKEIKGMAPKAVTMGKKQKQLLVRVMEAGFHSLRTDDQNRAKNKVKGPKPITDSQAKGLYRAVGYAFDIPCVLPVTTKARFKGQLRSGLKKLRDAVPLRIPGPSPKATVEPNNLPVIKEVKPNGKKALAF
jgi:hypothetical protein